MKNKEIVIIAVFLAIFLFSGFEMMGFNNYGMMNWMFGSGFSFMWIFMSTIWILVIVALVLFIVWLIRQLENLGKKK
ncbi:hypothetical protein COT60_01065 [Candidatus Pacearchaeota archaeon CG09_land_8_20_14_0_10_30_9]|nr:hypothetical protein [Candidatus Pacearchaeota archaeon]OIO40297.1 MAG: hypothetical protein AUJ61_02075 [Candidatus Pacearchaeota archaeon CG1_02_30_18]PIN71226.1 MAG: hypothetical protein COV77_03065 [Candidatus Pacearchaeota archaeon CG11_big_fil_rev_8_21_14_0_20_30_13]PIO01329.1 MAG: hypothetical protein COT60_01065 [Candidatus Pacearchaeota archaeon CG09_land_8_20_14_0_10_30_9]PIZ82327.1 MAG: hypothetical protein COX98_00240 [Candidatus Pacearchaeota archaeon CG_4_10_14_0_2_um_filter_30